MNINFFCVNMKGAVERRRHCAEVFARAGISVTFVDGINSKQLGLEHPILKRGKIGCYLSFYQLYEEIIHHNLGTSVIFEDDIELAENFAQRLAQSLATLPPNWEAAFIGWWPAWWNFGQLQSQPVNGHWLKITGGIIWGGYGQVINGAAGAIKMREALSTINGPFDEQMFAAVTAGHINGYFLKNQLVNFTNVFPSQTTG